MVKTISKKVKNKIDIEDFLFLIIWVKQSLEFKGKKFNHQNLLDQAETYSYNYTPLDTNIHNIDELIIDAYQLYHMLKEVKDKFANFLETLSLSMPFIDKDITIKLVEKYEKIFEDLIENYKFDDPETRGIQKGILPELLKKHVDAEEYEEAAKVRDMINEC